MVRAQFGGFEWRDAGTEAEPDDGRLGTMAGHFAVFDEWTEIDSLWEGRFMERISPGAFAKTIAENRERMRVTFQHGLDPHLGDKPLGPIEELDEDDEGARYVVPLLDAPYNHEILPGLRAGLYGSSFRFRVMKEELETKPRASQHNPERLPERTIKEAQVFEFGPVTYPAYAGATAGLRSMTDQYLAAAFVNHPERLRALLAGTPAAALPSAGAGPGHSTEGSRAYPPISLEEFLEKLES